MAAAERRPAAGPAAAGAGEAPPKARVGPERNALNDVLSKDEWGKHLRADYRHDGFVPNTPFNIGREGARDPGGRDFSEHSYWDYAMRLESVQKNLDFQSRMAGRIELSLPTITGTFNSIPTPISPLGNNTVGIVTDAGKFVTHYLGSKNVITFGTCLDPAPSAVGSKRVPIFFDASTSHLDVDMTQFGFDSNILPSIFVGNFTGNTVKTAWNYRKPGTPEPVLIDPATARASAIDRLTSKTINTPQGYYQSKATVADAYTRGRADADLYAIGKTMGDALLVLSAMNRVEIPPRGGGAASNNIENPFYGVGQPGWKSLTEERLPVDPPASIAFKTGDILNAVRAIFKGVPTVLENQAAGNKPKYFEFFPGKSDPSQTLRSIPSLYTQLILSVNNRYNALIEQYRTLRRSPSEYNNDYTRFSEGDEGSGARVNLGEEAQRRTAATVIEKITKRLDVLRRRVNLHFQRRKTEIENKINKFPKDGDGYEKAKELDFAPGRSEKSKRWYRLPKQLRTPEEEPAMVHPYIAFVEDMMREYNEDSADLIALCPQTDSPIRWRGDPTAAGSRIFMRLIVPVIRMTKITGTGVIIRPCEIHLYPALLAIAAAGERYQTDENWKTFLRRFPIPDSPEEDVERGPPKGRVREAVQDVEAKQAEDARAAAAKRMRASPPEALEGGARPPSVGYSNLLNQYLRMFSIDRIPANIHPIEVSVNADAFMSENADSVSTTVAFMEYIKEKLGNKSTRVLLASINRLRSLLRTQPTRGYVVEHALLEEIDAEFEWMESSGIIGVDITQAPVSPRLMFISLYNAFVSHVNHENATMDGGEDDIGFDTIESKFVERTTTLQAAQAAVRAEAERAEAVRAEAERAEAERVMAADVSPEEQRVADVAAAEAAAAARAVASAALARGAAGSPERDVLAGSTVVTPSNIAYRRGLSARPSSPLEKPPPEESQQSIATLSPGGEPVAAGAPAPSDVLTLGEKTAAALKAEERARVVAATRRRAGGGTPRRKKNRKATYRLKKKPNK
jgi:hypothetical protein